LLPPGTPVTPITSSPFGVSQILSSFRTSPYEGSGTTGKRSRNGNGFHAYDEAGNVIEAHKHAGAFKEL